MSGLRRPSLLRSLSFWSGVVMIGFILWAWWDSSWRWVYQFAGRTTLTSRDSGLTISRSPDRPSSWGSRSNTDMPRLFGSGTARPRLGRPGFVRTNGQVMGDEEARQLRESQESGGKRLDPVVVEYCVHYDPVMHGRRSWFLFIPYWCVLVPVATLWLGLIYWRHRRIARHLSAAAPDAESGSNNPVTPIP